MKYVIGCFILFISLTTYATTANNELKAALNQSANAWNRGDINAFMQAYKNANDTRYVSTNIISGYSNIRRHYIEKYADSQAMGKLDFKIDDIKALSTQYALVIGKWHLMRVNLPDVSGVFTLLFEKVNNDWKIVVDHTSSN